MLKGVKMVVPKTTESKIGDGRVKARKGIQRLFSLHNTVSSSFIAYSPKEDAMHVGTKM